MVTGATEITVVEWHLRHSTSITVGERLGLLANKENFLPPQLPHDIRRVSTYPLTLLGILALFLDDLVHNLVRDYSLFEKVDGCPGVLCFRDKSQD